MQRQNNRPCQGSSDGSRVTNETLLNITHRGCELDNDTQALMARLEQKYKNAGMLSAVPVTPPQLVLANEGGGKERLARWEEDQEEEENKPARRAPLDEESGLKRFPFHPQQSKRSLLTRDSAKQSMRSIQSDASSQTPSVISEQYLESVEDLPFDDDSFVPMMSPVQRRGHRQASIMSTPMQDIQEVEQSPEESSEGFPPPVNEIKMPAGAYEELIPAGYQSQKLSQFLKASGQDDQIAAATAAAFEAFLLQQEEAIVSKLQLPVYDYHPSDDEFDAEAYHPLPEEPEYSAAHLQDVNVYARIAAAQLGMNQKHAQARRVSRPPNGGSHLRSDQSIRSNYLYQESDRSRYGNSIRDGYNKENVRPESGIVPKPSGQRRSQPPSSSRDFAHPSRQVRSSGSVSQTSRAMCGLTMEDDYDTRTSNQMYHGKQPMVRQPSHVSGMGHQSQFDDDGRVRRNGPVVLESRMHQQSAYKPTCTKTTSVDSASSNLTGSLPLSERLDSLPMEHRACYNALKSKWEIKNGGKNAFPDELYLRFAMCYNFDFKNAWSLMKRFDRRYLSLSITSMEKALCTKTIFPVRGLKSRNGNDMLYMRPCRFFPGKDSIDSIIDPLVYVMGTMFEKEQACTDGIGVIMNMTDWKMANFSVKYWHKLMATLQGRRVPTLVSQLLIVNPPSWFGSIWTNMRPMLGEPLRSNTHRISFHEMERFLMEGFERFMPDEIHNGNRRTRDIVKEYITYRKAVEKTLRA